MECFRGCVSLRYLQPFPFLVADARCHALYFAISACWRLERCVNCLCAGRVHDLADSCSVMVVQTEIEERVKLCGTLHRRVRSEGYLPE